MTRTASRLLLLGILAVGVALSASAAEAHKTRVWTWGESYAEARVVKVARDHDTSPLAQGQLAGYEARLAEAQARLDSAKASAT